MGRLSQQRMLYTGKEKLNEELNLINIVKNIR